MQTDISGQPAGFIERFEIVSRIDAFGGATPAGAAGPYVLITGIVHGKVNPSHPDNAGIVDLENVPADADGYVAYSTDVLLLRPREARAARRVLVYEVANRGAKFAQFLYIGTHSLTDGPAPGPHFHSALRDGYTFVWSGWQGDILQSGAGDTGMLGTRFPVARNQDGSPITGLSREEYIADLGTDGSPVHGLMAKGPSIPLSYPPASLTALHEVSFSARQTWLTAEGQQDFAAPSVPIKQWKYVTGRDDRIAVEFTPPASVPGRGGMNVAPDQGTIYSFTYRAKDPVVMGIAFAAVRDLVSFLKHAEADASGNPNPLGDFKHAARAAGSNCAGNPAGNIDVTIGVGASQSGRFLRDFLYQDFNNDANGRPVFDGIIPIIAGGRLSWINVRFAQPGRWSKQHEDHWMPGDQFPFAYNVLTDPLTGRTDGIFKRCLSSNTCPKVMHVDSAYEWWSARASLVVTDGAGQDISLPENVRYYVFAGSQHNPGPGVGTGIVTQPAPGSLHRFAQTPVSSGAAAPALLRAMERWIVDGDAPPPSQYPTVAAGTAVPAEMVKFPPLENIRIPNGPKSEPLVVSLRYEGLHNQLFVTDYGGREPKVDLGKRYQVLVPQVDANGNDLGGIHMPEHAVPIATFTGWSVRGQGHAEGELVAADGMMIPFAVSPASRAPGDPRRTLAELYSGRANYQAKVAAAAAALVRQGYLTEVDAAPYAVEASKISPTLIPEP